MVRLLKEMIRLNPGVLQILPRWAGHPVENTDAGLRTAAPYFPVLEGSYTTQGFRELAFLGAAPVNTRITAESAPLHRGKTTQVWQTMIRSEAGKLCAVVTQTQMVLPAA